MGKCRGNLFPVRASSDTVPPLSGPGLCFSMLEANAVKTSSGRADARFYAHGRLYHGRYSYKSLLTHWLTVGSRFPPCSISAPVAANAPCGRGFGRAFNDTVDRRMAAIRLAFPSQSIQFQIAPHDSRRRAGAGFRLF